MAGKEIKASDNCQDFGIDLYRGESVKLDNKGVQSKESGKPDSFSVKNGLKRMTRERTDKRL